VATPPAPVHLPATDQQRLERLWSRGWALSPGAHPLGRLQGCRLGPYRLLLLLGPKNAVGARYFQLFLADGQGRLGDEPLALGLHNQGPFPGYNWIDLIRYQGLPLLQGQPVHLAAQGLDRRLLRLLASLLPAGGHLMVEYESPSQKDTRAMLGLGYPPAVTPLGALLLQAGCRSLRDWYIPRPASRRDGPWDHLAHRLAQGALRSLRADPGARLDTLAPPP